MLGYSENILYNSIENISNGSAVRFYETSSKKNNKASFTKYLAKYKLSNLYFDQDEFTIKVRKLYDSLFARFGTMQKYGFSSTMMITISHNQIGCVALNGVRINLIELCGRKIIIKID